MNNKLVVVVNSLIANTKANKIVWEKTFDRNGLQCVIADEIIQLTIERQKFQNIDSRVEGGDVTKDELTQWAKCRETQGAVLIRFYDDDGNIYARETSETINELYELYELASGQELAMVDHRFDAILSELNGVNR